MAKKKKSCKHGRRADGKCRRTRRKKRKCPPRKRLGPFSKLFNAIGL